MRRSLAGTRRRVDPERLARFQREPKSSPASTIRTSRASTAWNALRVRPPLSWNWSSGQPSGGLRADRGSK